MRGFRHLAVVAAIAGLVTGSAVTAASAATSHGGAQAAAGVHLRGGATAVTTAPGIASALLKNGIVPIATAPGTESLVLAKSGPAVRFTFPVTGGRVSLSPLGGKIHHAGGIFFANVANGKTIQVSQFTINLSRGNLTGIVNGNPKARVPLFNLDLSHAKLTAGKHMVTAKGIVVKLTSIAAKALNATLGTKLFSPGLTLGTAATVLRF
ncbi:MAG TPA: hypothetical protein VF204_12815 [Streptosporangiaceae bacterium]